MKSYINLHPGEETWEAHRQWQGCPTIAATRGGRLFAGWYTGGAFEPCIENYNVLVMSDDGGENWTKPILTIGSDRENRNRNIDIQLWVTKENHLWVMWTLSPYYEDSKPAAIRAEGAWNELINYHREFTGVECMVCKDPDAEELQWEEPRMICGGFLRCKPIYTSTGRIILPAYDWIHPEWYMLRFSDDNGATFYDVRASRKPQNCVFDETMVYEYEKVLYLRARTNMGYYACSESHDDGLTWSETKPLEPAPSTRLYAGVLSNGMVAYVRSISDTERTGMKLCLSADGGKTYPWQLVLDDRACVSYPDLTERDGYIYILHDRERDNRTRLDRTTWISEAAKEILLSRVTVNDVMTGYLQDGSYVARVISKGLVDQVLQ